MKKVTSKKLPPKVRKELVAVSKQADSAINTKDIPEVTSWGRAKRGVFFRPLKKQLTIRLDADVIAWFRSHTPQGRGYQGAINSALRTFVERESRRRST